MSRASGSGANRFLVAPSRLLRTYLEQAAAGVALQRKMIGEQIRKARIAKGWKQKRLAQAVHVEPQTVSNWERGVSTPDLDTLAVIADALGVEVSYFVHDPAIQAEEAASIAHVSEMVQKLLLEVQGLRAGQDEIGARLGRIEDVRSRRQAPPRDGR